MKKFRKAIVALLAMVMVLGCLAVTASAAEYTDKGKLYVVGSFNDWGTHVEMTGADGVYTYEVDLKAGDCTFKFTLDGNWDGNQISADGKDFGDPSNFSYKAEADGKYVIKIDTSKTTKGEGKAINGADAVTVAPKAADSGTGVSAPVVAAVIAVVSMVGIVVFTKRRTVAE